MHVYTGYQEADLCRLKLVLNANNTIGLVSWTMSIGIFVGIEQISGFVHFTAEHLMEDSIQMGSKCRSCREEWKHCGEAESGMKWEHVKVSRDRIWSSSVSGHLE